MASKAAQLPIIGSGDTRGEIPGGGGGDSHMKQTGMLVGNFEFNP